MDDVPPRESSPIAFALDFATAAEARAAATEVGSAVGMLKVGLELFVHAGPSMVEIGRDLALPVFLDLKLHDIPETVERAVAQASRLGARVVTVHAAGGRKMLERAVARAKTEGGTLDVCAVTVLTSLDDADLAEIGLGGGDDGGAGGRSQASLAAERLAILAYEAGVRWFVCSGAEVGALRRRLGDATLVTPGIRPAAAETGDQKRVVTPEQAIRDGADWLVVGRPIRDASDRRAAARALTESAIAARTRPSDASNVPNPSTAAAGREGEKS